MTFRVETEITGTTGAPYLSVMHFGGAGATAANTAGSAAVNFWLAMDNLLANDLTFTTRSEVVEFNPATGTAIAFHSISGGSTVGADTGEKLPFTSQALLQWMTAGVVNGKRVRGRTFIPGLTVDDLDEGRVLAATQSALVTNAGLFLGLAPFVVWSRPVDAEHATPNSPVRNGSEHAVTAVTCWDQFAVLRGRRD